MKLKITTLFLIFALFVANAQEIPNLSFTQNFDYPEGPQDGSLGSVLAPTYWTEYAGYKNISYVPVTSSNEIPVGSGTAIIFRIYMPPFVEKVSIGINGPDGLATQFMRVATISEDIESASIPTSYTSGDLSDTDWKWLSSTGNYTYTRDAQYHNTGSAIFFVIYNGANVDDNYDGVPEGDYPNTLTVGSFTMSWQIPLADTTNYINWANGTTSIETNFTDNKINIYPNPASTYLQVDCGNLQTESVQILDITGKLVLLSSLRGTKQSIDISNLQNGVYFIKLGNNIQKFIKN